MRSRPLRTLEHPALAAAACSVLAGVGAVLSIVVLLVPDLLPFDGVSAAFLLAACLAGAADPAPTAALVLAAAVGCILSPGLFGLALGLGLGCFLSARPAFGIVPVLAAAASLEGARIHPPGTGAAVAALVLSFIGAAPLLASRAPALAVAGLYVLARVLELCGPGAPGWWGLVLMPAGAALAAAGSWSAVAAADTVPAVGNRLFTAGLGVAAVALGTVAAARGSDLTGLAATAGAGLLTAVVAAGSGLLAVAVAARAVAVGAGTVRLSHLGGLAFSMPRTTACLAAAGASLAFLPPSWGFAGVWLTAQAVLGLPRSGTAGVVVAVSAAGMGLALGCALAAVLRFGAVACLGRPRTPRTSAATDTKGLRGAVPLLAGLLLLLAGLAAGPVAEFLGGRAASVPWLMPGLFALLVAVAAPAAWLFRSGRHAEPWNDGRDAPPAWLPFGDPAEQWGAASFAALFRISKPWQALRWRPRLHAAAPVLLFAVLLLAALAVVRP